VTFNQYFDIEIDTCDIEMAFTENESCRSVIVCQIESCTTCAGLSYSYFSWQVDRS